MLPTWQGQLWQAFTLFLYGLCIGSFSTVLVTRLQRGEQIVKGRSHCPHCQQSLGARDLIPVVSYLWLRGRCRHCRAPISPIYPLLELGAGLLSGGATLAVGMYGGLLALLLWPAASWLLTRRGPRSARSGYLLLEVVLAIGLLALTLASALDVYALVSHASLAGARRTQAIALASARFAEAEMTATWSAPLSCASLRQTKSGAEILRRPDLALYQVQTESDDANGVPDSCRVRVTVSCPTCSSKFGKALQPVVIAGLVRTYVGWEQ